MSGIRRVSDLGTRGAVNIVDGSIQTADIANNAITQAKLNTDIPLSGMRNAIINGAMEIWQRGVDTGAISGNTKQFQADRWWHQGQGSQNSRVRRSTDTPTGFRYSARVQRDSGSVTGPIYLAQDIETVNSIGFAGKQVTVSFWAKAGANFSASGNILTVDLASGTGTDETRYGVPFTGAASVINQNVVLTTSWQRFSITGSVGATAKQLGLIFYFSATGTASTDDSFYITGVQLEMGSQVTPFEQRSYATELQLCQRYFEKSSNMSDAVGNSMGINGYMIGCWYNDGWPGRLSIPFKVTKRSNAGINLYGPSGQNSGWWVYALNGTQYAARGTSGVTSNETYFQLSVSTWNGSSGTLQFSAGASYLAEGAWTASSEL